MPLSATPRLLIVDDEAPLRMALLRWFSRRGWLCAEAATLEAAERELFAADAPSPDVILCDLNLPDGSAEVILDRLERERPMLARRFVVATGDVLSVEFERRLARAGCRTLPKPYDLRQAEAVAQATHTEVPPAAPGR